jgi:purine-nucleoside phosphorylase
MSPEDAIDRTLHQRLDQAVAAIRERAGERQPKVGLILGSGLGAFADTLEDPLTIDYADVPHFHPSGVQGHAGRLVLGEAGGVSCVVMQGRIHYYEGHSMATVAFPTRTLVRLGAGTLIITNSAGGIADGLGVGDLMLIRDHLNLFGANPLRGWNDDRLGPRFPDLSEAYSSTLRGLASRAADVAGIVLREGVYAGLAGPSYETPAEIEMLRRMGGDAVGMSTVPEVIAANHMAARVLGISCITNLAAGAGPVLSHDDVTETTRRVQTTFVTLLTGILKELAKEESRKSASVGWFDL